jgi:PAS domain S-box-containing protein
VPGEATIDERIERLAQLAEAGSEPEAFRAALRHELSEALAIERKRTRLASVVAMSEEDAVRYRVISELASDWVYALRIDELGALKLEWVSGSFVEATGYTVDEINELGGLLSVIHPEDMGRFNDEDSPLERGAPATVHYRFLTKGGQELWLRDHSCPEHDFAMRVVRLFGAVKDVTAEFAAQQALQEATHRLEDRAGEAEARFRAVLDQAGEAIYLIDWRTGGFIDVNETACSVLGYTREELLTLSASDVETGKLPWATRERQKALRTRGFSTDSFHRRKDGSTFPVEIAVSLRKYAGKDHLVMVARDITDRKQMEVQLAQADRLASVGVLAAGVAHEVNNPLVYILNNISYALGEVPAENTELRDALREARSGAERVRDIVKDLRTFARSDERMGPVDVRQVLESAIKVMGNEIKFRARLVRDYEGNIPFVEANSRLGQVFLNLLMNAAHAIGEGDPEHNEIAVRVRVAGDAVDVQIRDTGVGIPPHEAQKIFDPFYTTKPVGMGTGLGLSICRNIVRALNGSLEMDSDVGHGSVFIVRLPISRVETGPSSRSGSTPPSPNQRPLRILLVDDDLFVARATKRQLAPLHDVTLAGSGAEGLELMQQVDFDVVVCDVMMPGMTGMEFHAKVAEQNPPLARRFVFITGGPFTPQARERFYQSNNPYIQKPFSNSELLVAIEAAMAQSDSSAALESA